MSRRQRDQLEVYCSCQRVVPWIRVIVMEVVGVQIEFGGGAKLFELGMGYVKWNPGIPTEFMWLVCGS